MLTRQKTAALLLTLSLALFSAGCKKKAPAPPPPPPPAPAPAPPPPPKAPVISVFEGEPRTIERGQSSTLRWATEGADSVTINPGIGRVDANGSRQVFPGSTTTYELVATGPGGTARRSVTINVNVPVPPPPPAPKATFEERVLREISDAFYDYDKSEVREDARGVLQRNAEALKNIFRDFPSNSVVVEGHCDERGSAEYNLGLGDRRATSAKEFLVQLGVPADRLKTVSYGKERPQCTESNESCWQRNRRAHFEPAR